MDQRELAHWHKDEDQQELPKDAEFEAYWELVVRHRPFCEYLRNDYEITGEAGDQRNNLGRPVKGKSRSHFEYSLLAKFVHYLLREGAQES